MENPSLRIEGPPKSFYFVGGGLGDVARRFYLTDSYTALADVSELVYILCWCHNPAALDFFRLHPNHRRLVICDLAHIYMSMMRGPKMDGREVNRRLFAHLGLTEVQELTNRRTPGPIGRFFAPDHIDSHGHIVLHPFGRGWGDLPQSVMAVLDQSLRVLPPTAKVFVISADYVAADGRVKKESFPSTLSNVTVLKNLSAPAAFTLVASASKFIGSMSALAQVAAFENVPSLVLHPARCSDFKKPFSNYAKGIVEAGGCPVAYDNISSESLQSLIQHFLDPAYEQEGLPGSDAFPEGGRPKH